MPNAPFDFSDILSYSTRLQSIIANLLGASTETLIEMYSTASSSMNQEEVITKSNILCVLIHRNEKEAKSFVKSQKPTLAYKSIKRGSSVLQDPLQMS